MNNNPLSKYIRAPKVYTKLPSLGKFYEPGMVETSVNGEVAVYPLTAIDQIMLKTPDAMLNGESLLKVVQNCVPGVKDVKKLVEPDINTLLLAIRIATTGQIMEIEASCPNCQEKHEYTINISNILETQTFMDDDTSMRFDDSLILKIRPYNFEQRNLQMLNEINEDQAIKLIENKEYAEDNERMIEISRHINKMAERTFDVVAKSISSITILPTNETVTDTGFIAEFLKGISKAQADIIVEKIKELNNIGIDTNTTLVCTSCNNEWKQPLDFDPSSFFA